MDDKIMNIFNTVENKIHKIFPGVNVEIEHDKENNEYFISIDDPAVYKSESFQLLATELSFDLIWPAHIPGVFFVFDNQQVINGFSIEFKEQTPISANYEITPDSFNVLFDNRTILIPETSMAA